ncbi:zinc ribbon domain-containing protein, partial [Frankia sp. CiP3]|uniref:zinc ribbon domain-containing protein n=1 Tax=Frankia sp. CiP3 TaxID=2880971 RepID=UPI001EF7333E
ARYNARRLDPSGPREPKRTHHPYQLRGRMRCGICQRRMQGSWNNGKPHYRCVYPDQYALANHIHHPRSVYIREELIVPHLDRWLARAFTPPRLPATIAALTTAQDSETNISRDADLNRARRTITDCDTTLERYRLALEAGTDPTLVARWTAKATTERVAAQARLRASAGRQRMTEQEITDMVTTMGDIVTVLAEADPADKAEIYTQLGLQLIYEPGRHRVIAEAKPQGIMYKRECPRPDTWSTPTPSTGVPAAASTTARSPPGNTTGPEGFDLPALAAASPPRRRERATATSRRSARPRRSIHVRVPARPRSRPSGSTVRTGTTRRCRPSASRAHTACHSALPPAELR